MKLTTDIFSEFDQVWALVTAGTPDNFNTMTISWGGMGTLWGKPVATVYIRTSRYTHEFDVRLIMNLIPDRSKHGGEKVPGTVNPNPAGKWTRCMTPG